MATSKFVWESLKFWSSLYKESVYKFFSDGPGITIWSIYHIIGAAVDVIYNLDIIYIWKNIYR
jgi:hypothetical protein